jgi:hypothetical protein
MIDARLHQLPDLRAFLVDVQKQSERDIPAAVVRASARSTGLSIERQHLIQVLNPDFHFLSELAIW